MKEALLLQHPTMMILCENYTPFTHEVGLFLMKIKLSLYRHITMFDNDVKSWRKDHANQLPNVAILMHQFLRISCSQIEIDFF